MLYHYHAGSGDGVAMAYKVGAELVNFEIGGIGAGVIGARLADKTICSHPSVFPDIACDSQGNFTKGIMDADKQFQIKREGHDPCIDSALGTLEKSDIAPDHNDSLRSESECKIIPRNCGVIDAK